MLSNILTNYDLSLHLLSWYIMHIITFLPYDSWHIMKYHDRSWHFVIKIKDIIFVAKKHNFCRKNAQLQDLCPKIYNYALIDNFWGSTGLINSPISYATLEGSNPWVCQKTDITVLSPIKSIVCPFWFILIVLDNHPYPILYNIFEWVLKSSSNWAKITVMDSYHLFPV